MALLEERGIISPSGAVLPVTSGRLEGEELLGGIP
jgi:hypothetical protein